MGLTVRGLLDRIESRVTGYDFEVVTAINGGQGPDEQRTPIQDIRWDATAKQLILDQDEMDEEEGARE